MEVLFVAHRAPYPPDKGDRLRAWRHLTRLARLGPVDIVAEADSEEAAEIARKGLAELCREVHVFPRRMVPTLFRVGVAALTGGSLTVAWHGDARVKRCLAQLEARHEYGVCWAFSSGTGPWLMSRKARPRIMDMCDVDALKWEALARDGRGPMSWVHKLEARRLLPLEVGLAEAAELTLVSTQQEADDLISRGNPKKLAVLTNGTPWEDLAGLPLPSTVGPVVGFLGQMDYPPNVNAVTHLAQDVLPRLRQTVPGARLRIMGRAPTAAVLALAKAGEVDVTGQVDSIAGALAEVAVFCAPLDQGRGIPNKILEAMAAGRATVVSSWSSKALAGVPGSDYVVADGAEDRARVISELLLDHRRLDDLASAGQAYVRVAHDWEQVLDKLQRLLLETVRA
ncbi:MAG: sugar transferase (PEP-CTERM/EpsH1 system associated) [Pseudohongiellaceae bacterium]